MSHIQRFFTVLFFASLLAIAGCSKSDSTSGIENTNDLDKDGIIDIQDPDIDGDGIPNEKDPDMDGDGIPNEKDPDANGDGLDDFGPPGLPGQCPSSADGTYPNCTCPTGSVYLPQANDCAAETGWNPIVEAGCYIGNSNIKDLVNSYIAGDKDILKACGRIGTWDVSGVTDMAGLFKNTSFNENINHWQVGQVTNFASMFAGAEQFNQPLNKWSINAKNLYGMFKGAKSFNQDIRGWNPPNVSDAAYGFLLNGTAFTYDLSLWCLDKVTTANGFAVGSPIADQPEKHPRWLGQSCETPTPEPSEPDDKICGVNNLYSWSAGNYALAVDQCATYLNDGIPRRIATLEEMQCLCAERKLNNAAYWTSTEADTIGHYYIIQGYSCDKDSKDGTTGGRAAACVTD